MDAALLALIAFPLRQDGVPPPLATPVEVVVSGRTSTLRSIAVASVDQSIPATFSGERLTNAPGFRWYVSAHYALQTDYEEERARLYLGLLELAYPHYVECFGRELPDLDTRRMAVVYAASTDSLDTVMEADGIAWDRNGGGIAYEGINAAFNYPSGSLQYHQRYIVLHEAAHLYQICLNGTTMTTPPWYYEGVADTLAHHVWEREAQRLTLCVVDKPTVNDWYDQGLRTHAAEPFRASEILSGARGGRELGFLLVSYLETDLELRTRYRIWRDELFRLASYGGYQAESERLIEELFGSAALDAGFETWLRGRRASFHYVDWGWEQDGDTLLSYGWPQTGAFSQTDLAFPPGEAPRYDPLVMDYPRHPRSELVDAVARGVQEPTVGCLVSFADSSDSGAAGLALGVEGRAFAQVLVVERKRLVLDGTDLGAARVVLDFPPELRDASERTAEIGLTVRIAAEALEVTARAGAAGSLCAATLALPLDASQRQRVLTRPLAVLSRDGRHRLTPYVDDARRPEPDLEVAAPPNRWRYGCEAELTCLERAAWRLGEAAPASLRGLRDRLLQSVSLAPAEQAALRSSFEELLAPVRAEVRACDAAPERVEAALAELRRE